MFNQEKTGKFIAEMRKLQNLSQKQLAEQIGVSDKTVSKWETGRSMPDNAILLELCQILQISVNELLSGERFPTENYVDRAEENMLSLMKESEKQKKNNHWSMWSGIFSVVMLISVFFFVIFAAGGNKLILSWYLDFPSFILVVGIPFFILVSVGMPRDFFMGFLICYGKKEYTYEEICGAWIAMKLVLNSILLAGAFTSMVGLVAIIGIVEEPEKLGPSLAVAMLTVFYSICFEILLTPTAALLKKKLMLAEKA